MMLGTMVAHGPRLRMQQHVDTYLELRRLQLKPRSRVGYWCTLSRFAGWWDSTGKVPKSMREQDLQRYIWGSHTCGKQCLGRKHYGPGLRETLGASTLNGNVNRLRQFLDWANRHDLVRGEVIDATMERARVTRRRRLQLDRAQLVELYEGAGDPYHRWVCALAVYTAGRTSELQSLRIRDLDLKAGELAWSRHKTGDEGDTLPVVAELEAEAHRWLDAYRAEVGRPLDPNWLLVPRRQQIGAPPTGRLELRPTQRRSRGLGLIVKERLVVVLGCNADDLRGEGVHTARRSMARLLYERLSSDRHPDPVAVVQALLGHSSRTMTERYIGVESGRLERDRLLRGRSMLGGD